LFPPAVAFGLGARAVCKDPGVKFVVMIECSHYVDHLICHLNSSSIGPRQICDDSLGVLIVIVILTELESSLILGNHPTAVIANHRSDTELLHETSAQASLRIAPRRSLGDRHAVLISYSRAPSSMPTIS
jgi:hypothetical protein